MRERSARQGESGSALVLVMVITALGAMAAGSVMFTTMMRARIADKQFALEQAFYLATMGAERIAAEIGAGLTTHTLSNSDINGGSYNTEAERQDGVGGDMSYKITSEGTFNGVTKVIRLHGVRQVSWSRYALWYMKSDPAVLWIAPGERFDGRVYSKPQMHFHNQGLTARNQVVFTERVWTSHPTIEKSSSAVNPIFHKGLVLNAAIEDMTPVRMDKLLESTREAGGLELEGETTIVFNDNKMTITNQKKGWNKHVVTMSLTNMVYVKSYEETTTTGGRRPVTTTTTYPGTINVSAPNGLRGRVTMVAESDINIMGHIRYKSDPETNEYSKDALGLIAQNNVVVEKSAPNNLSVYAHIIAKNGGFGVKEYNKGNNRGFLKVYGGIVNETRNAVGIVGGAGYSKNYIFDKRFERDPPPYYPKVLGDLDWDDWEG